MINNRPHRRASVPDVTSGNILIQCPQKAKAKSFKLKLLFAGIENGAEGIKIKIIIIIYVLKRAYFSVIYLLLWEILDTQINIMETEDSLF